MRLSSFAILSVAAVLGCGGRTAAPDAATPAPASRAPAAAAEPTSIRYAANAGRYRFEQQQHASQEVMGQVQETDATTNILVSTNVSAGDAGNLNASVTVDSVTVQSAVPGAAGALEALRGKTFRLVVTPMGKTVTFTPPDTSMVMALTGDMFRDFLPTLPTGSLAAGTTWVDTVSTPAGTGQMRIATQSVRTHRVVGWETREGQRALHVTTTGNYTMTGEGEQGGAPLQLTGTGTATSDRFISADGVYLGMTVNDSTNVRVNVVSMGLEVPVRQVRRTTVTRLP